MPDLIEQIRQRFERFGDRAYGEVVDMREHMLQTACLAERKGADEELVTACLLHDFGHLLVDLPEDAADRGIDGRHEQIGADALAGHFPPRIIDAIRLHVDAKRYLCAKSPEYLARLSPASTVTLAVQGGPMSPGEMARLESHPRHKDALAVRVYDDLGKEPAMEHPGLDHYLEIARRCALAAGQSPVSF